jgi:anti-anti-sigma factor
MDMTVQDCAVAVKQLPETLTGKQARSIFSELDRNLKRSDRTRIVLDFSKVRQIERSAIYLLLCCLEEAMKRNGDVKLAAIPSGARKILEITGVARLFETFDTSADAIDSFRRFPADSAPNTGVTGSSYWASENTA